MKIIFNEEETKLFAKVARNYNITIDRLLADYKEILDGKLEDDLWELARENYWDKY